MPETITSLIEKLEGAGKGGGELSAHVIKALLAPADAWVEQSRFNGAWCVYERREKPRLWGEYNPLKSAPVTTSIDAALALAERVLPGVWWIAGRGKLRASEAEYGAQLMFGEKPIGQGEGSTAALSLCAAILRAQSEARV